VLATRHAVGNRRRRHGVGARIAMLTSAGRVQRCRAGYRRSSNQANDSGMLATGGMLCGGRLTVGSGAVSPAASYSSRGHLALNGSKQWNERYGVSPTISCHFQFGWRHRKRRISRG
jgi:hypothetical protein